MGRKSKGARAAARALRQFSSKSNDPLSIHAQQALIKELKEKVSRLPLKRRIAWLKSLAGTIAFGSKESRRKIREINGRWDAIAAIVCSAAWLDAFDAGEAFPVPGMVLSREASRIGENAIPTRRYTPRIAVKIEDELDAMDCLDAARYDHPQSPSAAVIERIGWFKAKPQGGKW